MGLGDDSDKPAAPGPMTGRTSTIRAFAGTTLDTPAVRPGCMSPVQVPWDATRTVPAPIPRFGSFTQKKIT